VLILKFSEVYFNSAGEKIFDINLGNLKVINQLDIYSKVGKATAYDEFIEFEFKNGKIYYEVKIIFILI
jgi:Malectin domain